MSSGDFWRRQWMPRLPAWVCMHEFCSRASALPSRLVLAGRCNHLCYLPGGLFVRCTRSGALNLLRRNVRQCWDGGLRRLPTRISVSKWRVRAHALLSGHMDAVTRRSLPRGLRRLSTGRLLRCGRGRAYAVPRWYIQGRHRRGRCQRVLALHSRLFVRLHWLSST